MGESNSHLLNPDCAVYPADYHYRNFPFHSFFLMAPAEFIFPRTINYYYGLYVSLQGDQSIFTSFWFYYICTWQRQILSLSRASTTIWKKSNFRCRGYLLSYLWTNIVTRIERNKCLMALPCICSSNSVLNPECSRYRNYVDGRIER